MTFTETALKGLKIISPEVHNDNRGYFFKSFHLELFSQHGIDIKISQVNHSLTRKKGTIRGMHFQLKPFEEAKIIQCLKGKLYDIAIDLRNNSPTYGKWKAEILDAHDKKMIFIPEGFAHGFQTLAENTEVLYIMNSQYSAEHSSGVRWDDPFLKIQWPLKPVLLAPKDKLWPLIYNEKNEK